MYSEPVAITILFGIFIFLLIIRIPIAFTLLVASVATTLYMGQSLQAIVIDMRAGIWKPSLMAIPFFIFAGEIMGQGGISKRIIQFANLLVGRLRGGLAQVNVAASMFFGGISGSAIADVSSIGAILIPMMKKQGYHDDYSVGITVTSACQGVLVPPSHNMIIYSVAAGGVSIGALFLAGAVPGIILGLSLMVISYIIAIKRKYPRGEKVSFKQALVISLDAILGLFTAVIIMGGILLGVFTATESSAIACVYAFIITFFVYREIPLKQMNVIMFRTLKTIGIVMALIATASAFGSLMAQLKVPAKVTELFLSITDNKYLMLFMVNILFLVLGCIMDMAPLIVITTPILYPVLVTTMGVHPVHFGVIMILNLAIGLCTPPVGSALFVGSAIAKTKIETVVKGMLPFYICMLVVLFLITYIPGISLWLPKIAFPNVFGS